MVNDVSTKAIKGYDQDLVDTLQKGATGALISGVVSLTT